MKRNILKEKSFAFAIHIIQLYQLLSFERRESLLSKQMLRAGTAIGATVREAEFAQSTADCIHKLSIALKEANETDYWIELLYLSGYLNFEEFENIKPKITEQLRLLTRIINTSKHN